MRIIYNDGDINNDAIGLLTYINEWTKASNMGDVIIDDNKLMGILNGMKQDFPHIDGLEQSSVFKKMANFLCFFIAETPIQSPFPAGVIGGELAQISNHQNVIVGLQVVFANLYGATIFRGNGDEKLQIEKRVRLSKHSYIDIIEALSTASPSAHFHLVTVFLEQLVYKANPDLQYEVMEY